MLSNPKTNLLTKQLADALFALLAQKPLANITVMQVCQRAQVSRMSFYRRFTSLEAVIEAYIELCFNEALVALKAERPLNLTGKNVLLTTLRYFQKHTDYLQILVNRQLEILLFNFYNKAIGQLYQEYQPKVSAYSVNMLAGELFGLEMAWLRHGMRETPEELVELYWQITKLKANLD